MSAQHTPGRGIPKFGELPQSMVLALREADAAKRPISNYFAGPVFAGSCLAKATGSEHV